MIIDCVHEFTPPNSNIAKPPSPSSFSYDASYESYEELRSHVLQAKKAFDLRIAYVVYLVTMCSDVGSIRQDSNKLTNSMAKVVSFRDQERIFLADWLHHLLFSQAFNFKAKRVGCWFRRICTPSPGNSCLCLCAGVPVTVIWPPPISRAMDPCHLRPLADEVKRALRYTDSFGAPSSSLGQTPTDGWWRSADPSDFGFASHMEGWSGAACAPDWTKVARTPRVVPKNVHHWLDFFSAREAEYHARMAKASKGDMNTYRQRRNNVMDKVEFKPGVRVFFWGGFQ